MAINVHSPQTRLQPRFSQTGRLMLAVGVVVILMVMLIPMPTFFWISALLQHFPGLLILSLPCS